MKYLLKIWATTIFISPWIYAIVFGVFKGRPLSYFPYVAFMVPVSIVFSLPTLLLQLVIAVQFLKVEKEHKIMKELLSLVAIIGISVPFYLVIRTEEELVWSSIVYILVMVTSIWYFKITPDNRKRNEHH